MLYVSCWLLNGGSYRLHIWQNNSRPGSCMNAPQIKLRLLKCYSDRCATFSFTEPFLIWIWCWLFIHELLDFTGLNELFTWGVNANSTLGHENVQRKFSGPEFVSTFGKQGISIKLVSVIAFCLCSYNSLTADWQLLKSSFLTVTVPFAGVLVY